MRHAARGAIVRSGNPAGSLDAAVLITI
jgi:hypothetical protein